MCLTVVIQEVMFANCERLLSALVFFTCRVISVWNAWPATVCVNSTSFKPTEAEQVKFHGFIGQIVSVLMSCCPAVLLLVVAVCAVFIHPIVFYADKTLHNF